MIFISLTVILLLTDRGQIEGWTSHVIEIAQEQDKIVITKLLCIYLSIKKTQREKGMQVPINENSSESSCGKTILTT